MLIDISKMALDTCFSFLNRRNELTNLKVGFLLKTANKKISTSKIASPKLLTIDQLRWCHHCDYQIQIAPYTLSRSTNLERTINDSFLVSFLGKSYKTLRLYLTTVFSLVPWQALEILNSNQHSRFSSQASFTKL